MCYLWSPPKRTELEGMNTTGDREKVVLVRKRIKVVSRLLQANCILNLPVWLFGFNF